MNPKELTKIFMMISNWKNPLVPMVYAKNIQRFNPLSAGTVFIRQNLTSVDVKFCRRQILTYKDGPRTERYNGRKPIT